mmetsp:Transcript_10223/g.13860  ORF Transcript_10223/g.13860 Transcript_10223/m.13860 type:complete len:82 (-) Transcript_10223:1136-1381(-)
MRYLTRFHLLTGAQGEEPTTTLSSALALLMCRVVPCLVMVIAVTQEARKLVEIIFQWHIEALLEYLSEVLIFPLRLAATLF